MPRGENKVVLTLEAEFLEKIREHAGNQHDNTFAGKCLLDLFLEKKWIDKETYGRLMKNHWGLTITEQRDLAKKKEFEKKRQKAEDKRIEAMQAKADLLKAEGYREMSKGGARKLQKLTDEFVEQIFQIREMKKHAQLSFKEKKPMLTEKLNKKLEEIRAVSPETAMEFEERYKPELEGKW